MTSQLGSPTPWTASGKPPAPIARITFLSLHQRGSQRDSRPQDMYIAIAAANSDQRRLFIDACVTGFETPGIVADGSVEGGIVRLFTCDHQSCRMHLVEIPDLDTTDLTNPSNVTAYRGIASVLGAAYGTESGSLVKGVIYIGIAGQEPAAQLLELVFGNDLTYSNFTGNPADAEALCLGFMSQQPGPTLPIQNEFIAEQRKLQDTSLGLQIFSALQAKESRATVLTNNEDPPDNQSLELQQSMALLADTFKESKHLQFFVFSFASQSQHSLLLSPSYSTFLLNSLSPILV
jgi:hypothetical protein